MSVLNKAGDNVEHSMTSPHATFAACTCEAATQQKMCHHQVAFLLSCSLDRKQGILLIYRMLGTRFGLLGGCDQEDIGPLWRGLRALAPEPANSCETGSAAAQPATEVAGSEAGDAATDVAGSEAGDAGAPSADALTAATAATQQVAPVGLGAVALRNGQRRIMELMGRATEQIALAPPAAQAALLQQLESNATASLHVAEAACSGTAMVAPGADFHKAQGVSYKRKQSFLEGRQPRKGQSTAAQRAAQREAAAGEASAAGEPVSLPAGQKDFAHRTQLDKREPLISKAWQRTKTAHEAARNFQACIDHSLQRAETSAATPSAAGSSGKAAKRARDAPPAPEGPSGDQLAEQPVRSSARAARDRKDYGGMEAALDGLFE